jgi:hypothetical protein
MPPKTLGEAKKSPYWSGFEEAIRAEIESLEKNQTWEYVSFSDIPVARRKGILRSKLVFDIKRGASGEFQKYKARMVAMGFTQVEGVDYVETFASVMMQKSFRIMCALWNCDPSLSFEHWDVKTAFVNAPLSEVVYVHQLKGFEKAGREHDILRLKKALYGTKQAAHAWQEFLVKILVSCGAVRHPKDECIFVFREGSGWVMMGTHVDDLFPLYNVHGRRIRDKILTELKKNMTIDERGTLSFALDTKIERDPEKGILKISQRPYIEGLLKEYGLSNTTGRATPGPKAIITRKTCP